MIKLSKRLEHVSRYVKKNSIVIDVGTDHGLLPMYLVENKIVKQAIASDVVSSIVTKTRDAVNKNGFGDQIKVVLSDGLKNINDKKILGTDTDTIVIAGMGGILTSDILKARKDYIKNKNLILSPHRDDELVRRTLHELGFKITSEEVLEDREDKYYHIICAKTGSDTKYTDNDYKLGKKLINKKYKDDELIKFLNHLINKNKNVIDKLSLSKNSQDKISLLKNENEMLKEILKNEKLKPKK